MRPTRIVPIPVLLVGSLVLASGAHAATFVVPDCASDARWGPMAAPGTASVSPATVPVASVLGLDDAPPLVVELALPDDALIVGRGLPPLDDGDDPFLVNGYDVDRSVVHLELPFTKAPASAEEESPPEHSRFTSPRVCGVDAPYAPPTTDHTGDTGHTGSTGSTGLPTGTGDTGSLYDYEDLTCPYVREETLGMWQAWHVVDEPDGSCTVTEVQVARTLYDQVDREHLVPRMGVWLEPGYVMAGGDRVIFEIRTRTPMRATDWSGIPYQPSLRWAHTSCPGYEDETWPADCYTEVSRDDTGHLDLMALEPSFLRINQPLDHFHGEPLPVETVLLDRYGNPTFLPGKVEVELQARSAKGAVYEQPSAWFVNHWQASAEVTVPRADAYTIEPLLEGTPLEGLTVIRHWTRVWRYAPDWVRNVGDLHFHTGILDDDETPVRFLDSGTAGDHRGQTARTEVAYRYLDEVMGLDFGAASEHAVAPSSYQLPAGSAFDAFRPGGACDIGENLHGVPDWWTTLQRLDRELDRPDFAVFPAFEWHTHQDHLVNGVDVTNSRLHRVVVYREVPTAYDLPMLPGTQHGLLPQCLPYFLAASGLATPQSIEDIITIPHMSRASAKNLDWDLTYDWSGEFSNLLALVHPDPDTARALLEEQTRLVEVFSARANNNVSFEGRWTDGSDPERWTVRYALAQGVHAGLIASSDNHSQTPGSNNDRIDGEPKGDRHHEPGGLAFSLRRPAQNLHHGVFDALRDRRTYASSGIRAWLDVTLRDPSQPMLWPVAMGDSLESDACELELSVQMLLGMDIQNVDLYEAQVLHTPGGLSTSWKRYGIAPGKLPTETFRHRVTLDNPGIDGEWVYYIRGRAGPDDEPDQEVVWSSPIWVHWGGGSLCP